MSPSCASRRSVTTRTGSGRRRTSSTTSDGWSRTGASTRLASAALVINLLPVYDDLDRAVSNVDAGLAGLNWVQGVLAIHHKFGRLLEAMNVHEIEAADTQFDPAQHEAIGRAAGPEGKVLQVVQKGYTLGDKVIRPAMVIVGDGSG
jgi:molecular chaperone GrpE